METRKLESAEHNGAFENKNAPTDDVIESRGSEPHLAPNDGKLGATSTQDLFVTSQIETALPILDGTRQGTIERSPTKSNGSDFRKFGSIRSKARLQTKPAQHANTGESTIQNASVGNVKTLYAFGQKGMNHDTKATNLQHTNEMGSTDEPNLNEFPVPGGLIYTATAREGVLVNAKTRQMSVAKVVDRELTTKQRQSSTTSLRQPGYLAETEASASNASKRRLTNTNMATNLSPNISPKETASSSTGSTIHKSKQLEAKIPLSTRNAKAKSLQPSMQTVSDNTDYPSVPDQSRSVSASHQIKPTIPSKSESLNKSLNETSNANLGLSRRLSTYSHAHATGLGARTVSPTDARRMKRLSVLPTAPPIPSSENLSPSLTPTLINTVASVGPVSSSTPTPDIKRKSFNSVTSTGSNNSSIRVSTGSVQSKSGQVTTTTRLPTTKGRPGGSEEDIPPVPPLPKALTVEENMNPLNKVDLGAPLSDVIGTPTKQSNSFNISTPNSTKMDPEMRRKRGVTLALGHSLEPKTSTSSLKRSLQPLQLPPLNLLPLSTPTIAKVNAFNVNNDVHETAYDGSNMHFKPSDHDTPTTPLTASKVSFADAKQFSQEFHHLNMARSSSSSLRAASSVSSNISGTGSKTTRHSISPYITSSTQRTTSQTKNSNASIAESKTTRRPILHLAPTALRQPSRDNIRGIEPSDPSPSKTPETPTSGSSIRRKLSLSWKRSSSKASHAKEEREAEYPLKSDAMLPPPRLTPASTWAAPVRSSSPTSSITKMGPPPRYERRYNGSNVTVSHERTKSESWNANNGPTLHTVRSDKNIGGLSSIADSQYQKAPLLLRTPSVTSGSGPRLITKSSSSSIRSLRSEANTDTEDALAEEEMRKLASKRKGLEAAAIEVDALQKRAEPKERSTVQQTLKQVDLNIYERGEIVDYKDIYFVGSKDAKKIVGDLNSTTALNFGYDDDRGDYSIVPGDHLRYRYEIIDILGKGSFGQVVRCIDHKTGGLVAVKIIRNKKRFHQQALVEVNILQKLREWDPNQKHSLVSFTQSFYFRGHLCISTELLGMNLYEFIKSNDFRGFSLRLIRRFTKQLLSSLVLLKSHRVIHCDLKPENVLLAHPMRADIKVIDFGSSCFENEKVYTYIQSRFYRSPEVILGMNYGLPIDMWSLGCILAELFTGYPIFPGENEQEQLACIMEMFGPPEKHLIEKSTRKKLFFDSFGKPRMIVSSKGRRRRPSSKTLQQALKCDDELFLDFLTRCLRWDPDKRLKPDEALKHEFVTGRRAIRTNVGQPPDSIRRSASGYLTGARPLPEPPAPLLKAPVSVIRSMGVNSNQSSSTSGSPSKGSLSSRRQSVASYPVSGVTSGTKRFSNGAILAPTNSSLPRFATRNVSVSVQSGDSLKQ